MRLLIKIGGTLLDNLNSRNALAEQIAALSREGHAVVVVHGGGRQLTNYLEERGISSRFEGGFRVTEAASMDGVLKVLAGSVNKELTGALRACGSNAVGISGIDGRLTTASRMSERLGFVGVIDAVDPALLGLLTGAGMIPVVACVGGDDNGQAWNINADQMAAACAQAFAATRLLFLTDVAGVLDCEEKVLPVLGLEQIAQLIESGVARGGMQAKLNAAAAAVRGGVGAVVIAPGASPRIVTRLMAGESGGTEIHL